MVSKRLVTYIIVFNIIMSCVFVLSSQLVLSGLVRGDEVVSSVGIVIDTKYIGPIELTPTGSRAPLWNYPLFVFILALIGNAFFILLLRREKRLFTLKTIS